MQEKGKDWEGLAITLMFAAGVLIMIVLPEPWAEPSRDPVPESMNFVREFDEVTTAHGWFRFTHRWSARSGVGGRFQRLTVDVEVPKSELVRMTDHFGMPESWVGNDLTTEEMRRRVEDRGFTRDPETGDLDVDYRWIVDESQKPAKLLAAEIQRNLRQHGLTTKRDLLRVAASFVQTIEYAIPAPLRQNTRGHDVLTYGVATPVEVLFNRWGDCDSKSLLFASVLEQFPDQKILLVVGLRHMFVAVRDVPRAGEHFVEIKGVPYVLIELTTPTSIGQVGPAYWRAVHDDRMEFRDF